MLRRTSRDNVTSRILDLGRSLDRGTRQKNYAENLTQYNGKFCELACSRTIYFFHLEYSKRVESTWTECTRKNAAGEWWPIRKFYRGTKKHSWKFLTVSILMSIYILRQEASRVQVLRHYDYANGIRRYDQIHFYYEFTLKDNTSRDN